MTNNTYAYKGRTFNDDDLYAFMDEEGTTDGAPFLTWDTDGMLDLAAQKRGINRYDSGSMVFPQILTNA